MRPECRDLTDAEVEDQHPLYMAVMSMKPGAVPVSVGELFFCPIHRRPLIECHDERNPPNGPVSDR